MIVGAFEAEGDDLGCDARAFGGVWAGLWVRVGFLAILTVVVGFTLHVAVFVVAVVPPEVVVVDGAAALVGAPWWLLLLRD